MRAALALVLVFQPFLALVRSWQWPLKEPGQRLRHSFRRESELQRGPWSHLDIHTQIVQGSLGPLKENNRHNQNQDSNV